MHTVDFLCFSLKSVFSWDKLRDIQRELDLTNWNDFPVHIIKSYYDNDISWWCHDTFLGQLF